jgi:hypothetical protein
MRPAGDDEALQVQLVRCTCGVIASKVNMLDRIRGQFQAFRVVWAAIPVDARVLDKAGTVFEAPRSLQQARAVNP